MVSSGDKKMPNGILEEQGTGRFALKLSLLFLPLIQNYSGFAFISDTSDRVVIKEKIV